MRLLLPAGLLLALASGAFAQHRGGFVGHGGSIQGGGGRSYGLGFGNIVFPGGTSPIPAPAPSFGQRLGGTIRGNPIGFGNYGQHGHADHLKSGAIVPYPVFVGGYGYGGYGYGYPPEPSVTVVQQPPALQQPGSPTVIINHYYTPETAKPVMRDYTTTPPDQAPDPQGITIYRAPAAERPAPAAQRDQEPTLYLIAYKNGSIFPALGYWIEGDTLQYITTQGTVNKASLALIDRELSERLNRERNVEFSLAKPAK